MQFISSVPGLVLKENVITEEYEAEIINWLDGQEWSTELPRRTQHYGYKYNYKSTILILGNPFVDCIEWIRKDLIDKNVMLKCNQCIVNEYTQSQNIGKHIDGKRGNRENIFGPSIVSISLNEDTNFIFRNTQNGEKVELFVPQRSLLLMTGESRYLWTHEIPRRNTVQKDGKNIKKGNDYRRISLTFRYVKE